MAQETLEKFEGENKENSFKQTEIGSIPEDWEVVRLEEVGKIITGNTPSKRKKEYWENGEIDFIKPPDLKNTYITSFSEKISLEAKDKARIVPEKSILVSCIGIIGRVGYTLKPVAFNQQINAIIPFSDKIDSLFLFFALQTQVKQIESLKSATTVPIVNKAKFSHVRIPLPPLEEQRKIARVLDKIQQAIELQDRIVEQAKRLKKSLMQKLFTEGLYSEEQKETEIGLIPKSWEVVRLGEVAEIKYGKSKPKQKGNIPVVGSGGIYDYTNEALINIPTIVIGRKGTAGKCWLIMEPCYPSDTTFYLSWKTNNIDIRFLYNWMQIRPLSGEHAKTTLPSLQKHDLETFLIPFPPLEEQKQIAHILSTVDRKIEVEQKRKQVLKELFKTMLHKLMSGEIRLKEVEI